MITRELRDAIQRMEKLQDALKNIHLLELLPEIFENQQKLTTYIEKMKDDSKSFKEKVEKK